MKFTFCFKKTPFVFIFVLCFVISFSFVEAERIRIKKIRSHISPKHISLSARSASGVYARRYSYGRPIPNYSTNGIVGRNRRNFRGRKNIKRDNGSRTYASRYRNWTPNKSWRNNPRIDGPYKKRKEPYPLIKEPQFGSSKQKRRIRPHRLNPIQKPLPPKKVTEFDDEYFFPEEAKRGESKYEFESRYPRPKRKRKNPGEVEKPPRKPELSKIPYYDEKPLSFKSKVRERPISYSSFIQHPSGSNDEDFYEETDSELYSQPAVRNKKKRVKKKTNTTRNKIKDEEYYRPNSFEKYEKPEAYPPYLNTDDFEFPRKSAKKGSKIKQSYEIDNEDDFGPPKSTSFSKRPQVTGLFSTSDADDFRGSSKDQQSSHFNPSYSQSWSSVVETTARPVQYQTENGFQPQYNYQNRDYSSLQKTKTVTTNTQHSSYYSQPEDIYKNVAYKNYISNQVSTTNTNSQTPVNYNYNAYSNSVYSNQPSQTYSQSSPTYSQSSATYSQPSPTYSQSSPTYSQSSSTYSQQVPSSSTHLTDVTVQKSVPIYDNTETFYNFNNNAYVNSQSSKYHDFDNQKYSSRLSTPYTNGDKSESDDFIKKHQNLYNNGLSGVPVQGDGYTKSNVKKDYDIGYGDFQFDENPTS